MDKRVFSSILIALLLGFTHAARAENAPHAGFRGLIGYQNIDIGDYRFSHDTHPQDSFLPGAGNPGSAGTTSVDGRLNLLALGVGYRAPVAKSLFFNFDVGGLFGGARDELKNVNDSRPDANAAFVYSEARWGLFAAAGLTYHLTDALYAGAEAQLTGIHVDSGWDRYGEDQSEQAKLEFYPSVGPLLGYAFSDRFSIEGSVQFGRSTGGSLNGVWNF